MQTQPAETMPRDTLVESLVPNRNTLMVCVVRGHEQIDTPYHEAPAKAEQEILARIDRAGLYICEAELRHALRWHEQEDGPLLDVLGELEREGLIESALHFRLTERGRTRLPVDYQPPLRYGTGIPWRVRS
jgi:hypothetical protein